MGRQLGSFLAIAVMAAVVMMSGCAPTETGGYKALEGVGTVKAFFDVRDTNPKVAAVHMKVIMDAYTKLVELERKPVFVVNFIGGSVKLLSSNREAYTDEEKASLDQIDEIAGKMSEAGIQLEVCMAAANILGVAPESLNPKFEKVPNGWIAEIGYQAKGYALVPVF